MKDKDIDTVRGLLLGHSNDVNASTAAMLRQAESMLRYFQLTRQRYELDYCTDYHCSGDCGLKGHGWQHKP